MTPHTFVHQDVLIDPFMTDRKGLSSAQPTRDLLGTPIQLQFIFNHLPRFRLDAYGLMKASTNGQKMGLLGSITSLAAIPPQLSADGRFMASEHFGDFSSIMVHFQQGINLVSLFLGKLCVAHKHSFDWQVIRGLSYRSLPPLTIKVALVS
jgi:hypothetical protein